jgi:glutamate dehydrogenase/leucine dehydrogenase
LQRRRVIVSYFEWVQSLQSFFWNETEVVDRLFRVLEQSFGAMIKRAKEERIGFMLLGRRMEYAREESVGALTGVPGTLFPESV